MAKYVGTASSAIGSPKMVEYSELLTLSQSNPPPKVQPASNSGAYNRLSLRLTR